jgi:acyl-CoA synthetase (AMP-forming)/AMP-acid ligase II
VRAGDWLDVVVGGARLLRWAQPWTASSWCAARDHGLTLAALVPLAAARDPAGTALVDEDGRVSYAGLDALAGAVAVAIPSQARRVAVLGRNGRGLVAAMVGSVRSGADVLVLNADMAVREIAAALDVEGIDVVVVDGDDLPPLPDDVARIDVRDLIARADTSDGSGARSRNASAQSRTTTGSSSAGGSFVMLTSGTTGAPRGARLARNRVLSALPVTSLVAAVPWSRAASVVVSAPVFHGYGLGFLSLGLAAGVPVVLHRRPDADVIARGLALRPGSILVGVPPVLARVARAHTGAPVAAVLSGAGLLHPSVSRRLVDAFGPVLFNLYGSHEEGWSTLATPADLVRSPGTVGRPAAGIRVVVLDDDGRLVERGVTGRICVRSRLEFAGYTDGSRRGRLAGYADSGDLGHVDGDGLLHIDGRTDDMVVTGGENVALSAVESVLLEHPDVADARVDAVPDHEFGVRLVARVVPVEGADPQVVVEGVKALARERLATYARPREVEVVPSLDVTSTGKPRRPRTSPNP